MAKVSRKCKNPCPLDKLIGTLAKELGVTKDVARYIYDTMGAVVVELLEEYDTIKVLPMMKIERYDTKPRRMKNLQTGEIECSVPRELVRTLGGCCLDRRRLITTRSTPTYVIKCNLKHKSLN